MELSEKLLGGGFVFRKGNKELRNVKVLKLTISTGRFAGVGIENFHSKLKPSIRLRGFNIVGFNTLNNDRTRFDIPLGQRDGNTIVVNINWIKRKSSADFIVVGHTLNGIPENDVEAILFPGLSRNVAVSYGGLLIKKTDNMNFEPTRLDEIHESL